MVITNDFIAINNPKTGSSFVTRAINNIYKQRYQTYSLTKKISLKLRIRNAEIRNIHLPSLKKVSMNGRKDQHGTYSQIPHKYLNREIVSVIRNPYTKFLSIYNFRFWKEFPDIPVNEIKKQFPNFPELSLDDFVDYSEWIPKNSFILPTKNKIEELNIGRQTIQFIHMFFKDPQKAFEKLNDDYIYSGAYQSDIGDVTFLKQEHLNVEFSKFLKRFNYSDAEVSYVANMKKVNVTNKDDRYVHSLTEKAVKYVRESERYLLKMLKDLEFDYLPR